MSRRATILYQGRRAICPKCSGMMTGNEIRKKCIDCGSIWKCVGEGITENELQFEEITKEEVHSA